MPGDVLGNGAPIEPIWSAMRSMGLTPTHPPSAHASTLEALNGLWSDAGLTRVETRTITIRREFESIDAFWELNASSGPLKAAIGAMEADAVAELKQTVRARLSPDVQGRIAFDAVANAVKGQVPTGP